MSLSHLTTEKLFACLEQDFEMLDFGEWVPDHNSIQDSLTVLQEIKDRMIASAPSGGVDEPVESDEEPVLRRFHASVTRVAHSQDRMVSVLAASESDAERRACQAACDLEFSDVSAEYLVSVCRRLSEVVEPGSELTWRDPDGGREQSVVLEGFRAGVAVCTTESGGEVEALPDELF